MPLLDQRPLYGNIVCHEIRFALRQPDPKTKRPVQEHVRILVPIVRDVLNEAIAAGGSSLRRTTAFKQPS
jgi:formamidopyrimidine-DNA glycosylase